MIDRNALGHIIWETSSADEQTISVTGANIVADAILASGWLADVKATALEEAADRLDGDPAAALWEMWDTARNQYTTPTDALRARAARIREEGRA